MADEGNIGNNKRDIPTNNVYTFIEALKKESITTQNYPMWKEKFLSVLGGLDTQIFSIADARRERKNEIVVRVRELEEQGMDKSTPGFDVALDLLQIMPDYEKEINVRAVEIEAFLAMFVLGTKIIETMRGLGISEEVAKWQNKLQDDNWNRMQDIFKNHVVGVMDSNAKAMTVQIAHAEKTTDRLLESLDVKDKILKDMMKKINGNDTYEQPSQDSNVHEPPQDSHTQHTPKDNDVQQPSTQSTNQTPVISTTETQIRKVDTFQRQKDVQTPIILDDKNKTPELGWDAYKDTVPPKPAIADKEKETCNKPLTEIQTEILKLHKERYKGVEIAEKLKCTPMNVCINLKKIRDMGYNVDE